MAVVGSDTVNMLCRQINLGQPAFMGSAPMPPALAIQLDLPFGSAFRWGAARRAVGFHLRPVGGAHQGFLPALTHDAAQTLFHFLILTCRNVVRGSNGLDAEAARFSVSLCQHTAIY